MIEPNPTHDEGSDQEKTCPNFFEHAKGLMLKNYAT